jgi:hypothetical protein
MTVSGMGLQGQRQGSPGMAVLAGIGVAVAGSVVWGLVAYVAKYQFSLLAVVLGFAVGAAMFRAGGHNRNTGLAVAGAALAVFGCALGSLLAEIMILRGHGVPLGLIMSHLDVVLRGYPSAVGGLGLFFWAIAALYGYRNALGMPMWGRGRRRPVPQAAGPYPGFGAGPQPPATGADAAPYPGFGAGPQPPATGADAGPYPGFGAGPQPPATGAGPAQPPVTGFGPGQPPVTGFGPGQPPPTGLDPTPPAAPEAGTP